MRVLLRDYLDGAPCGIEINYVTQDTEIYVDCSDMTEQNVFEFDNVLAMQDMENKWIYVILPSQEECERYITELVEKGCATLTAYSSTTFLYPDDEDLIRLKDLSEKAVKPLDSFRGQSMKGGHNANCNHFTGKKNPIKNNKRRVVREAQEPHKNKYEKFSKIKQKYSAVWRKTMKTYFDGYERDAFEDELSR